MTFYVCICMLLLYLFYYGPQALKESFLRLFSMVREVKCIPFTFHKSNLEYYVYTFLCILPSWNHKYQINMLYHVLMLFESHTTSSLDVVWRTWYFLPYHVLQLPLQDLVWPPGECTLN